jgi:hypothetical protein
MKEMFRRLDVAFDLQRLRQETETLLTEIPWAFESTKQIALQMRAGSENPWHESCRAQREIRDERDYRVLIPELRGTYFETVLESLPFEPCRARLLGLVRRACYSTHRDPRPRYHIAIVTSPHALVVFPEAQLVVNIPADGCVYYLDTREPHTALNGGEELRIHLVVSDGSDVIGLTAPRTVTGEENFDRPLQEFSPPM